MQINLAYIFKALLAQHQGYLLNILQPPPLISTPSPKQDHAFLKIYLFIPENKVGHGLCVLGWGGVGQQSFHGKYSMLRNRIK